MKDETGDNGLLEFIRRCRSSRLSDEELIELLLWCVGRKDGGERLRADALRLRDRYIDVSALLSEEYSVLATDPAIGERGADGIKLIKAVCDRCAEENVRWRQADGGNRFDEFEARLIAHFRGMRREETVALYLDGTGRLIAEETVGEGSFSGSEMPIRRIAEQALRYSAAALIVAHNHPGGSVRPSGADEALTARLRQLLSIIDVRLAEHFIISGDNCCPLLYLMDCGGTFREAEPSFRHEALWCDEDGCGRDSGISVFGANPEITVEDRERYLELWNPDGEFAEEEANTEKMAEKRSGTREKRGKSEKSR